MLTRREPIDSASAMGEIHAGLQIGLVVERGGLGVRHVANRIDDVLHFLQLVVGDRRMRLDRQADY